MKIIDLTYTISEETPFYPGTRGPVLKVECTHEAHGYKETMLNMLSHTGTHMDSPNHIFKEGISLEEMDISSFAGKAVIINCSSLNAGEKITMAHLNPYKNKIDEAEFIIFRTDWDKYWGKEDYFGDYPTINMEVADFILKSGKKGVGIDTIGIDSISDGNLPIHKKLLKDNSFVIIENLTNLSKVGEEIFTFYALPLKFISSDGSPVRAIAVL